MNSVVQYQCRKKIQYAKGIDSTKEVMNYDEIALTFLVSAKVF